jgi:hypothetical protein
MHYCFVTTAAVVAALPRGHDAEFEHDAGFEHAAPFSAAGAEATAAADFEPTGHEPAGQCDGSGQTEAETGAAGV